jgi:acyl-CoA thioester hydrolase
MPSSDWEALAGFPVVLSIPVLWGDMDPLNHVNNTRFFRWFESARVAYLNDAIVLPHDLGETAAEQAPRGTSAPGAVTRGLPPGVGPILAAIHCNYRRQVTYPDTIEVGARIVRLGNSSMTMQHHVVSHKHGKVAAEGESVVVMFDYRAQRPVRISAAVRAAIEAFEGHSLGQA